MHIIIGLALGLIIAGLVMAWLAPGVGGVLATVVRYVGIVLIVVGLVLLLTPVLVWVNVQLRAMLWQA